MLDGAKFRICGVAVLVVAVALATGCSSSSKSSDAPVAPVATVPPVDNSTAATLPPNVARPRLPLEFREVKVVIPASKAIQAVGGSGSGSGAGVQRCSTLVTPADQQRATNPSEVLFDRPRANCYLLGPSLVPAGSVDSATVMYDPKVSQWATIVHFANDDFLEKVARPLADKQIGIVLAGFVQSAPIVKAGITGRDAEIVGGFTKAGAIEVAAVIMGVAPSKVHVESSVG